MLGGSKHFDFKQFFFNNFEFDQFSPHAPSSFNIADYRQHDIYHLHHFRYTV